MKISFFSILIIFIAINICGANIFAEETSPDTSSGAGPCASAYATATKACLENQSVPLQEAATVLQVGMVVVKGMTNISDQCSKNSEIMDAVQKLLTAYQGICVAAQMNCHSKCDTELKTEEAKRTTTPPTADENKIQSMKTTISKCAAYQKNLMSAGFGIVQAVQSSQASKRCEQQVTNNANETVNCTLDKFKNEQQCICLANPKASGCPSSSSTQVAAAKTGVGLDTKGGNLGGLSPTLDPADISAANAAKGNGADSGTAAGSGASGGSGGSAGGPLASNGSGNLKKTGSSKDVNIYSGDMAGGGGGRRGGFSQGWQDAPDLPDKYKLKKEDIARNVAAAMNKDVTGKAGKSNWEKVSNTYFQNTTKLLNNR